MYIYISVNEDIRLNSFPSRIPRYSFKFPINLLFDSIFRSVIKVNESNRACIRDKLRIF